MSAKIRLNKPDNKYIAGEHLQGTVTIDNDSQIDVRSVYILITGVAKVKWTVQQNKSSKTYKSEEQYLNSKTVLFGTVEGPTIKFPAGHHSYQFECALPERLPGTMKTSKAEIKYKVKLVMDIPWAPDIEDKEIFTVHNIIDLNRNATLRLPVQLDKIEEFFSCCSSSRVMFTASVPQGGFVANEDIPVNVKITNEEGSVFIYEVRLSLVRKETAISTSPSRKEKQKTITETEGCHQLRGDLYNKTNTFSKSLRVPSSCPVSMHYAAYIRTEYYIELEFAVQGCHMNAKMQIPVEIGSIALSAPGTGLAFPETVPLAPMPQEILPSAPIESEMPPTAPLGDKEPLLVEQPPPTYEEVTMAANKDVADVKQEK